MKNKLDLKPKSTEQENVNMSSMPGRNIIQTSRHLSSHEVVLANAKTNRKEIVHKAGEVAVVIEGIEYDPKDLKRFNGSPLHYFVIEGFQLSNSIIAFKTLTELQSYLKVQGGNGASFPAFDLPRGADMVPSFGEAYNTKNYNESEWLNFPWPDCGYDDLSAFPRISAGVTVLQTWDNCISSVILGVCYITLFSDSYYRGSSYTLGNSYKIPDLTKFGMNDKASSIFNFGISNPGPMDINRGLISDTHLQRSL